MVVSGRFHYSIYCNERDRLQILLLILSQFNWVNWILFPLKSSEKHSYLCSLSLALINFPDVCKIPKLQSLLKKVWKTDPQNCRPKSLLLLLSKFFEIVVLDQANDSLSLSKIFYFYESRFRMNHSADICIYCFCCFNAKIVKWLDNGVLTGTNLIDVQKTFDTINLDILSRKLNIICFSDDTVK